jgi:spore cortex biosynthesis protein YabQ
MGGILGAFYDIFRVLRMLLKHNDIIIQLEDFIFWLCCAFFMFYFLLVKNDGIIRIFTMIGALIGAVLYFFIFSDVFIKFVLFISKFSYVIIRKLVYMLSYPLKLLLRFLKWIILPFIPVFLSLYNNLKKDLQKSKVYATIRKIKMHCNFFISQVKKVRSAYEKEKAQDN